MLTKKNKKSSRTWSSYEHNRWKKRLLISLFFVLLFYAIVVFFTSFYFLDREIVIAYNLSFLEILTFKEVSIGIITLAVVSYLVLLWILILHFAFLWMAMRNDLFLRVVKNKENKNFQLSVVFSLTLMFNWFLILKYLLALEKFHFQYEKKKKEIFQAKVEERERIKKAAVESLEKLKAKQLIEDESDEKIDPNDISINNSYDWKEDSTNNIKSKYHEIINTNDLSDILNGIKENENQLRTLKKSLDEFLAFKQKEIKAVAKATKTKNEIINKAILLKEIQDQEIAKIKRILELNQKNEINAKKFESIDIEKELEDLNDIIETKKGWLKKLDSLANSLDLKKS